MPQNAFMAAPETRGRSSGSGLSRDAILNALENLADALRRRNVTGELCLFGGSVMVLAFNARPSTKDVDAIFEPVNDIVFLVRWLGIKTAGEVLDLVARYYPENRIPVKTQFLVEGLFEEGKI